MSDVESKAYYPVFLDLSNRLVVVVGGTPAAERKARGLAKMGADVVLIASERSPEIVQLEADGVLTTEARGYVRGDLEGAFLVICATGDDEIDQAVFGEAEERGALINVIGRTDLCSFIIPSRVNRGALQIAISTGGTVPSLAKRVRAMVSESFGPEWGPYVTLLAEVRAIILERAPLDEQRIFDAIAASDLLARLAEGAEIPAADVYAEFVVIEEAPDDQAPDDDAPTLEDS